MNECATVIYRGTSFICDRGSGYYRNVVLSSCSFVFGAYLHLVVNVLGADFRDRGLH